MKKDHKRVIQNYISAYNAFDIEGMITDLHDDVVFENVTGGEITMRLEGIKAFKKQAEAACSYFTSREQTIQHWEYKDNNVVIEIAYHAVLAVDLPNGMKAGEILKLSGKSVFSFIDDRIAIIRDES